MHRHRILIAASLAAVVAFAARLLPTPRTIDDAYITFRYARNLLAGDGFVYNAGERVLGTSTPLYTLLMAGLSGALGWENYPWLALLVNAAADALACVALFALGARLSGRRAVGLAAAFLWAVSPMSVTFAVGGMETSVFILLLTTSAWLHLAGHSRWAALTSGLMVLARPDGLIFAGLLWADMAVRAMRARRAPLAEASLLLAVLGPWTLFATLTFGSPIPHSLAAKAAAYQLPPEAALVRLIQHYGTPFFEHEVLGNFWPLAGFVLYLALSLLGGLAAVRRDSRAWPMAVYPWVYFGVFAAANPLIFRWYLAPPLPFYFVLILMGLDRLLAAGTRSRAAAPPANARPRVGWRRAWLLLPATLFMLLSLNAWTLRPDHGPPRPAPQMAYHLLELFYTHVALDLAPRVTPATVIAAGDVGVLGYYTGARILDTVGLMSPEALPYFPLAADEYVIVYAMPGDLIVDLAPDYVVLLEVYGRNGLLRDARFTGAYMLERALDTDIYGSRGMLVWRRADVVGAPRLGAP